MLKHTKTISFISLFAALCYIGFTFFKINIPLPSGSTAIHFGNIFCVLAALCIGGTSGGIAGALGMGIADLMDPLYISSFPKTVILKFMIGCIVGYIAHKKAKIKQHKKNTYVMKWCIIASSTAMIFNIIMEPCISFLYSTYILETSYDISKIFASWTAFSTSFNACTTVLIANILYLSMHNRLRTYDL